TAEMTFRGANRDETLNYGVTAFYNWHEDPQLFAEVIPGNRATLQVVNQDSAISYGLEVEGSWRPTEALLLDAGLGLLRTEITDPEAGRPDLEGNSFGQDPEVTFSLGVVYQITADISVDGRATYRGKSFSDFNNTPGDEVGDYWLVDLGATGYWGPFEARAYITNLFDEAGATRYVGGGSFVDLTPPRSVGVTVTTRF
ncbi:MAG: TonB-dependent receptor, partial [Pseudomonadota bacterium]